MGFVPGVALDRCRAGPTCAYASGEATLAA